MIFTPAGMNWIPVVSAEAIQCGFIDPWMIGGIALFSPIFFYLFTSVTDETKVHLIFSRTGPRPTKSCQVGKLTCAGGIRTHDPHVRTPRSCAKVGTTKWCICMGLPFTSSPNKWQNYAVSNIWSKVRIFSLNCVNRTSISSVFGSCNTHSGFIHDALWNGQHKRWDFLSWSLVSTSANVDMSTPKSDLAMRNRIVIAGQIKMPAASSWWIEEKFKRMMFGLLFTSRGTQLVL